MHQFHRQVLSAKRLLSASTQAPSKAYFKMSNALQALLDVPYFGKEVVNRVSFLREDADFISNLAVHPLTRFIFYHNGDPLVNKRAIDSRLVVLTNGTDQLTTVKDTAVAGTTRGLLDSSEWRRVVDTWCADNKEQLPQARAEGKPSFLFLGLKDESVGLDFHELKLYDMETYLDHQGRYFGIPYFGVDVSNSLAVAELVKLHILLARDDVAPDDLIFTYSRKHTMAFTAEEAGLFSHGKMYFDWLGRNRFCPGCGSVVIGIHAGGKLKCTNEAKTEGPEPKYTCPVRSTRVSNVSFPRTDAVVITAITNRERTKMLLSLNKRYLFSKMYSCTAGFMEPSETVEVATKREIWEETGVVCSEIQILMTQPWPFPGNLMIGCVATVDFNGENEVIHLGHDRELADARWFDVSFVRKLVSGSTEEDFNPDGILLPTDVSIAYSLIKHVIDKSGTKL